MAKKPGFDSLPNGRFFNEWFGEVTADEMRMIRSNNMSPMDFTNWRMRDSYEPQYDIFGHKH